MPAHFPAIDLIDGFAVFNRGAQLTERNVSTVTIYGGDSISNSTGLRSNISARSVEPFGEYNLSKTLHAMVIAALHDSKRFIIIENEDRAVAIFKGSTVENTSQELHAIGEGTSVAGAVGG